MPKIYLKKRVNKYYYINSQLKYRPLCTCSSLPCQLNESSTLRVYQSSLVAVFLVHGTDTRKPGNEPHFERRVLLADTDSVYIDQHTYQLTVR